MSLPASVNVDLSSMYLGNFAASVLYGITSLQTFIYFKGNNRDHRMFKALISFLWILDTIHIAFIVHIQYHYTVAGFANVIGLLFPTWSVGATVLVTCISDIIVRSVFAHRIWRLSQKKIIYPLIVFLLSFTSLVGGFVCAGQMFTLASLTQLTTYADSFFVGISFGAAADLSIAVSMVYLLIRSQTGFKRTDSLLTTLMIYAINTGLFTTAVRLMALIAYAVWTDRYISFGIYYVLPELSLNALLATLNAREALRERMYGVTTIPLELGIGSDPTSASSEQAPGSRYLTVHVDKQMVTSSDP